jgi:hypothetical protein
LRGKEGKNVQPVCAIELWHIERLAAWQAGNAQPNRTELIPTEQRKRRRRLKISKKKGLTNFALSLQSRFRKERVLRCNRRNLMN